MGTVHGRLKKVYRAGIRLNFELFGVCVKLEGCA